MAHLYAHMTPYFGPMCSVRGPLCSTIFSWVFSFFFSPPSMFLINTYWAKLDGNTQNFRSRPLSRPHQPLWGNLEGILRFEVFKGGMIGFSWNTCSNKKTCFTKVDRSTQKLRDRPLSKSHQPFLSNLVAILDFWGSPRRNNLLCMECLV